MLSSPTQGRLYILLVDEQKLSGSPEISPEQSGHLDGPLLGTPTCFSTPGTTHPKDPVRPVGGRGLLEE